MIGVMPVNSRPQEPMLTVTELNREIRENLEGKFSDVWVEGEISNYRPHSSGHHYFTLKDARAQLSCVMFRGQASALPMASTMIFCSDVTQAPSPNSRSYWRDRSSKFSA